MASNVTVLFSTDSDEAVAAQPTRPLIVTSVASAEEVFIKVVTPKTIRARPRNLDLLDFVT